MTTPDAITHRLLRSGDVAVYLGSRRAGTIIRADPSGYAYVPAGAKRTEHGAVYPTVTKVLDSLL